MGEEVKSLQDTVAICAASAAEIYAKRAARVSARKFLFLSILTLGFVTKLRRLEWISKRASKMLARLSGCKCCACVK